MTKNIHNREVAKASADKIQRQGEFEGLMKQGNKRWFHKCVERLTQRWPQTHLIQPRTMVHVSMHLCRKGHCCVSHPAVIELAELWLNIHWEKKKRQEKLKALRYPKNWLKKNYPALLKPHKQPANAPFVIHTHACDLRPAVTYQAIPKTHVINVEYCLSIRFYLVVSPPVHWGYEP